MNSWQFTFVSYKLYPQNWHFTTNTLNNIYFFLDEKTAESRAVLDKLENIDSETDNLDISFVKMEDPRYARKWGVTKLPAIVYFRKRFPSIYRGKNN